MRVYYIYKITNQINGHIYVGKRVTPEGIKPEEDAYMGSGIRLLKAYKKYGKENFKKVILEVTTKEQINEAEKKWIKELKSYEKDIGYNLTQGGDGGFTTEFFTDEQRQDWIEKSHSHEITEETRKKLSEALKRARAEKGSEWAKDYTPWNKGLKTGPSPFKGKKRGPLSLSDEGKQHKVDFCKVTFTGKAKTKEHREKISKTLKGRKQKPEVIQHMRDAKQKFFENFQYEVRTCPYCGKQGKSYAMDRWHFERCKFKEVSNAGNEDGFSNEKGSTL